MAPPNNLDVWRTALFLGVLHDVAGLRVIGVDGQIGPLLESATTQLCARGWLNNSACIANQNRMTYEVTDTQRGWFRFHHHHFHISISAPRPFAPLAPASEQCLLRSCAPAEHDLHSETVELIPQSLPFQLRRL